MKKFTYLVLGGGIAGGKAVEAIRKNDRKASIALVTDEPHRPYQRPPLTKGFLRDEADLESVFLEEEDYYDEKDIQIIAGKKAIGIEPDKHQVNLEDQTTLEYSKLLLATGGKAVTLDIPGSDLDGVFSIREIEDSRTLRDAVGKGSRVLVMGGSFIGCETAASLTQMGAEVAQIFPEENLLEKILPHEASQYLRKIYEERGIRVISGTVAEKLQGQKSLTRAVLVSGELLEIDLVVMGVGIRLNTDLAKQAGLDLDDADQAVLVDGQLRTSHEDIYAAGDIAAWPDENDGTRLRVEHWDVARRQGQVAGRNMTGQEERYNALPYFFSDLFDLSFEVWGNLDRWNKTVLRGSYDSGSFAIYYFFEDKLVGVLAVARPDHERQPMQQLVKKQPVYAEIADVLKNQDQDLSELT